MIEEIYRQEELIFVSLWRELNMIEEIYTEQFIFVSFERKMIVDLGETDFKCFRIYF